MYGYGPEIVISKSAMVLIGFLIMIALFYCIACNKEIFPNQELLDEDWQ